MEAQTALRLVTGAQAGAQLPSPQAPRPHDGHEDDVLPRGSCEEPAVSYGAELNRSVEEASNTDKRTRPDRGTRPCPGEED